MKELLYSKRLLAILTSRTPEDGKSLNLCSCSRPPFNRLIIERSCHGSTLSSTRCAFKSTQQPEHWHHPVQSSQCSWGCLPAAWNNAITFMHTQCAQAGTVDLLLPAAFCAKIFSRHVHECKGIDDSPPGLLQQPRCLLHILAGCTWTCRRLPRQDGLHRRQIQRDV